MSTKIMQNKYVREGLSFASAVAAVFFCTAALDRFHHFDVYSAMFGVMMVMLVKVIGALWGTETPVAPNN